MMTTDFQTTKVYFSSWLPTTCPKLWSSMRGVLQKEGISYALLRDTADIWCRDYMPIQTSSKEMVVYKYSPDYLSSPKMQKYMTDTELMKQQIKEEFGEMVTSDVIESNVETNGESTSSKYWENTVAIARGDWNRDTQDPEISVEYINGKLIFTAEVWGEASEIVQAKTELEWVVQKEDAGKVISELLNYVYIIRDKDQASKIKYNFLLRNKVTEYIQDVLSQCRRELIINETKHVAYVKNMDSVKSFVELDTIILLRLYQMDYKSKTTISAFTRVPYEDIFFAVQESRKYSKRAFDESIKNLQRCNLLKYDKNNEEIIIYPSIHCVLSEDIFKEAERILKEKETEKDCEEVKNVV